MPARGRVKVICAVFALSFSAIRVFNPAAANVLVMAFSVLV